MAPTKVVRRPRSDPGLSPGPRLPVLRRRGSAVGAGCSLCGGAAAAGSRRPLFLVHGRGVHVDVVTPGPGPGVLRGPLDPGAGREFLGRSHVARNGVTDRAAVLGGLCTLQSALLGVRRWVQGLLAGGSDGRAGLSRGVGQGWQKARGRRLWQEASEEQLSGRRRPLRPAWAALNHLSSRRSSGSSRSLISPSLPPSSPSLFFPPFHSTFFSTVFLLSCLSSLFLARSATRPTCPTCPTSVALVTSTATVSLSGLSKSTSDWASDSTSDSTSDSASDSAGNSAGDSAGGGALIGSGPGSGLRCFFSLDRVKSGHGGDGREPNWWSRGWLHQSASRPSPRKISRSGLEQMSSTCPPTLWSPSTGPRPRPRTRLAFLECDFSIVPLHNKYPTPKQPPKYESCVSLDQTSLFWK